MDPLPIQLSESTGVPRYRQIVDQIADLVRSGQLPPGSLMPSVRDLARQLLVSLITTRRAYADLEAAGLLVRRQGQGTFVAEGADTLDRHQARATATALLEETLEQARRLGLSTTELRAIIHTLLSTEEDSHA